MSPEIIETESENPNRRYKSGFNIGEYERYRAAGFTTLDYLKAIGVDENRNSAYDRICV